MKQSTLRHAPTFTGPLAQDSAEHALPTQQQLFGRLRPPVLAAWGAGVDSTAMLIELVERGETVDWVLFADTGGEKPKTYAFVHIFWTWLRKRNVPCTVVRYTARDFKNWPAYRTLEENCLTNGTLPSMAFGFGSCSQKWKIAPQNRWTEEWAPAREIWAAGGKVIKLIGYDCSAADSRRYAEREGYTDARYAYRYPLREWGWTRERCIERIAQAQLPIPPKSACFYLCLHEVSHLIVSRCFVSLSPLSGLKRSRHSSWVLFGRASQSVKQLPDGRFAAAAYAWLMHHSRHASLLRKTMCLLPHQARNASGRRVYRKNDLARAVALRQAHEGAGLQSARYSSATALARESHQMQQPILHEITNEHPGQALLLRTARLQRKPRA